jgi:hypothetical protein
LSIDEVIADLTDNFVTKFWEQVQEIYHTVHLQERQNLIWKALSKKEQFFSALQTHRDWLTTSLAETRSTLISDLNTERDGLADYIGVQRAELVRFINACADNLRAASDAARDAIAGEGDADDKFLWQ